MDAGTVIREEVGLTLDKADKEVLGHAAKVVLTKDSTTIVGDGSTQEAVNKRVAQIRNLIEVLFCRLFLSPLYTLVICAANTHVCICKMRILIPILMVFAGQAAEQDYEREKLNERIAKLSGGVAVIQVISDLCIKAIS